MSDHIIHKINFSIEGISNEEQYNKLANKVFTLFRSTIQSKIRSILDKYDRENYHIIIESIDIDIGEFHERKLESQISHGVERYLHEKFVAIDNVIEKAIKYPRYRRNPKIQLHELMGLAQISIIHKDQKTGDKQSKTTAFGTDPTKVSHEADGQDDQYIYSPLIADISIKEDQYFEAITYYLVNGWFPYYFTVPEHVFSEVLTNIVKNKKLEIGRFVAKLEEYKQEQVKQRLSTLILRPQALQRTSDSKSSTPKKSEDLPKKEKEQLIVEILSEADSIETYKYKEGFDFDFQIKASILKELDTPSEIYYKPDNLGNLTRAFLMYMRTGNLPQNLPYYIDDVSEIINQLYQRAPILLKEMLLFSNRFLQDQNATQDRIVNLLTNMKKVYVSNLLQSLFSNFSKWQKPLNQVNQYLKDHPEFIPPWVRPLKASQRIHAVLLYHVIDRGAGGTGEIASSLSASITKTIQKKPSTNNLFINLLRKPQAIATTIKEFLDDKDSFIESAHTLSIPTEIKIKNLQQILSVLDVDTMKKLVSKINKNDSDIKRIIAQVDENQDLIDQEWIKSMGSQKSKYAFTLYAYLLSESDAFKNLKSKKLDTDQIDKIADLLSKQRKYTSYQVDQAIITDFIKDELKQAGQKETIETAIEKFISIMTKYYIPMIGNISNGISEIVNTIPLNRNYEQISQLTRSVSNIKFLNNPFLRRLTLETFEKILQLLLPTDVFRSFIIWKGKYITMFRSLTNEYSIHIIFIAFTSEYKNISEENIINKFFEYLRLLKGWSYYYLKNISLDFFEEKGGKLNEEQRSNLKIYIESIPTLSQVKRSRMLDGLDDGIAVTNAGLVLLWPFLLTLYKLAGLLDDQNNFIDKEAKERAIFLLQYIATKQSHGDEPYLVLNKILVGVPLDEPISNGITMTEKEKDICDALLINVIRQWKAMGNSSPDNLRGSFLIRGGVLQFVNDQWFLTVESKAFDMLLKSLPWTYSMIKISWLPYMIKVDWE